jgi:hypothetical protein
MSIYHESETIFAEIKSMHLNEYNLKAFNENIEYTWIGTINMRVSGSSYVARTIDESDVHVPTKNNRLGEAQSERSHKSHHSNVPKSHALSFDFAL